MKRSSIRRANKAAADAAARMREAGEKASLCSTAVESSPDAADKRSATPNFAGARGHPHEASSPASSAVGGIRMDVDLELEVVYSGESDSPSDSKSPVKSSREAVGAGSMTSEACGGPDTKLRHELLGPFDEFKTRLRDRTDRARIRTRRVQNIRT